METRMLHGRCCRILRSGEPETHIFWPVMPEEDLEKAERMLLESGSPFLITAFDINDWNDALSPWPAVIRDLALTVDEERTCGEMMSEIARACKQVTDVELFDIYRGAQIGEGKKSMAFKIRFESDEHALQPEEVDKYIKKILGNLKFKLGAEIR